MRMPMGTMTALARRALPRRTSSPSHLMRGGCNNVLQTMSNEVCSGSVKDTGLGFASAESELNVIARKRQNEAPSWSTYSVGGEKCLAGHFLLGTQRPLSSSSLHTLADCQSVQPCRNGLREWNSPWTFSKSLRLRGIRHESVYEKKMREIRLVRARLRRMQQPSGADEMNTTYSTYDEDPSQPPLSQPLRGSLRPTSPEEQNRYVIMDPRQPQAPVGYVLEASNVILRQVMRTRRPFVASIFDGYSNEIFKVRRPAWLINSSIFVEVNGQVIGECHRRWHLWRRIYDVYLGKEQFAVVENPGFWHWTFSLKDKNGGTLAEIARNWRGFGYEFLTDAGQYVIRFGDIQPGQSQQHIAPDEALHGRGPLFTNTQKHSGVQEMQQLQTAAEQAEPLQVSRSLTLSERAVALALAVSLDNDYFSRHSHAGVGTPLPYFGSE
ncbi:hypothetical protein M758_11G152800 [Ceratodon purpureus]|uniref:Phospholipid scramblase n=1 Tax=Ceratodon purpureus TaxID=3225 RepID=A0A8T0GEU1_CERPU|nr:hypothetical protein KC19_11G156900 [Ceratodon purpureus]KAG0601987.1 hypothetical protein M758_11G152800 [Ceratodon purpureus]